MFNKVRSALYNVVGGVEALPSIEGGDHHSDEKAPKFPYARPHFLLFQKDEVQVSADHQIRPIIVPRDITKLPWQTGYAETVNAGKSVWNEDQACVHQKLLVRPSEQEIPGAGMPYVYFALFDGHAGHGAAVAAANQLHNVVHEKLMDVIDHILPPLDSGGGGMPGHIEATSGKGMALWFPDKVLPVDLFIIGALESAFHDMVHNSVPLCRELVFGSLGEINDLRLLDAMIGEDKKRFTMKGGCTALVALFIAGKLYVANAGDSRAVRCVRGKAYPMSNDFTPSTERRRLQQLAAHKPELLSHNFTHLEFSLRPGRTTLGRRILYRDTYMTGWAYKTCALEDLRIPVVAGEGKRSRLLATIGVTRGLGDHELRSIVDNTPIKPFLSSQAEVKVFSIEVEEVTESDVLVMGTDGLWDVTSNEKTAEIVQISLDHFPAFDKARSKYRYTSAAQDLVMHSRGKPDGHNWQTSNGNPGTIDDISVFVIPLLPYQEEYTAWKKVIEDLRQSKRAKPASSTPSHSNTSAVLPTTALPSQATMSHSRTGPNDRDTRRNVNQQNGVSSVSSGQREPDKRSGQGPAQEVSTGPEWQTDSDESSVKDALAELKVASQEAEEASAEDMMTVSNGGGLVER